MTKMPEWLPIGDKDPSRRTRLLHTTLLILVGATILFSLITILFLKDPGIVLLVCGILLAIWFGELSLTRRNQIDLAGISLTVLLYIIYTVIAIFGGGITGPSILNYFTLILIAGLIISSRAGLIVTILTSISTLALYFAEINLWLPEAIFPITLTATWFLLTCNFLMVAILLSLANREIRVAFRHIEKEITDRLLAEEALHSSGVTIQALIKALPDKIFRVDANGTILDFLIAEDLEPIASPKSIRDFLSPDVINDCLEKIGRTFQTGKMQTIEYSKIIGGETSYLEARMIAMDDRSVLIIVRDISERVSAAHERESLLVSMNRINSQLRTAAEISKSCNTILNTEMLLVQVVNLIREGFNLYYVGLFLVDEIDQSAILRAGTGEAGRQLIKEKHHLALAEKSMVSWCITHGETRVAQQADHDTVRFANPLLPETRSEIAIPLISRGRTIGALTIQDSKKNAFSDEDITMLSNTVDQLAIAIDNANLFEATEREICERKKIELELQQERDFAVQVMNALGQGVTVTNREGYFEYVNPAYATMVGLSQDEIIGKKPEAFSHPEDMEILSNALQQRKLGNLTSYQIRLVQPNGEVVHTLITGAPRYQNSENIGSIAVTTDLTEHMHTQAERETLIRDLETKNTELEQFTYTVSHDLKSPLITIRGFLGYLEEDVKSGNFDRLQSDLRRIGGAATKMQQLLDELLELSRIGRLMNPPVTFSFEELIRDAVGLVEGRLDEGGIQVSIGSNMPDMYGDRARLLEVLQNLIDNAAKFMGDQPHPWIEIGCKKIGKEVAFFVKDNGIGINPQYHERVFGLFNKLDSQTSGTGVGLALVKRIIEIHNGKIWIESEGSGKGTTFWFTLAKPNEVK